MLARRERAGGAHDAAARLKGIMISLSAALVLYDNYLLAISLYQEEPRLLLNNKDAGYGIDYGELNRVRFARPGRGPCDRKAHRH